MKITKEEAKEILELLNTALEEENCIEEYEECSNDEEEPLAGSEPVPAIGEICYHCRLCAAIDMLDSRAKEEDTNEG
jgi:hypothetical protein